MEDTRNRIQTPEEYNLDQITPYVNGEVGQIGQKPLLNSSKNRENQISMKGDVEESPTLGLADIDECILYYFTNVIRPTVIEKGSPFQVPLLHSTPERWKAMQSDGGLRDKNGKLITSVILYKRTSVERNRNMGNKVGAINPRNYQVVKRQYSKRNAYSRFNVLNNRLPEEELYSVVIPDFVDLTYTCTIHTPFIEHNNKIIEAINHTSDTYWGDPDKFQFRAMIDSYSPNAEMPEKGDRVVKTEFTIKLLGYIIPDTLNTQITSMKKGYSKTRIVFDAKTT